MCRASCPVYFSCCPAYWASWIYNFLNEILYFLFPSNYQEGATASISDCLSLVGLGSCFQATRFHNARPTSIVQPLSIGWVGRTMATSRNVRREIFDLEKKTPD